VHDQLAAKDFDVFRPTIEVWSGGGSVRRLARVPMFRGCVFLRHAMDKAGSLETYKTRGLTRILGERRDRLDAVPHAGVESIRRSWKPATRSFPVRISGRVSGCVS
jgi:hypothetical protein